MSQLLIYWAIHDVWGKIDKGRSPIEKSIFLSNEKRDKPYHTDCVNERGELLD